MRKFFVFTSFLSALLKPRIAAAQALFGGGLADLVLSIQSLLLNIIPILVALALVFFFWGIAKYMRSGGDETALEESKSIMKWGIVALFIMTSIWGIIQFVQSDTLRIIPTDIRPTDRRL